MRGSILFSAHSRRRGVVREGRRNRRRMGSVVMAHMADILLLTMGHFWLAREVHHAGDGWTIHISIQQAYRQTLRCAWGVAIHGRIAIRTTCFTTTLFTEDIPSARFTENECSADTESRDYKGTTCTHLQLWTCLHLLFQTPPPPHASLLQWATSLADPWLPAWPAPESSSSAEV